ncbi:MAG: hypothetical protein JST04_05200 [Bdellovibrionales bacterium]|nr:hypothetical protein [Bdellovibrionales bacterium]
MKNHRYWALAAVGFALASSDVRACAEQIGFRPPVKSATVPTTVDVTISVNGKESTVTDDDGVFMTMLAYQYAAIEPIDPPAFPKSLYSMEYNDWEKVKAKPFKAWNGPIGKALRESVDRTVDYFTARSAANPNEKPSLDRAKELQAYFKGKSSITFEELGKFGEYLDAEAENHGYSVKTGAAEGYYALVENNTNNPIGLMTMNFGPYKPPFNLKSMCPVSFPKSFADVMAGAIEGKAPTTDGKQSSSSK